MGRQISVIKAQRWLKQQGGLRGLERKYGIRGRVSYSQARLIAMQALGATGKQLKQEVQRYKGKVAQAQIGASPKWQISEKYAAEFKEKGTVGGIKLTAPAGVQVVRAPSSYGARGVRIYFGAEGSKGEDFTSKVIRVKAEKAAQKQKQQVAKAAGYGDTRVLTFTGRQEMAKGMDFTSAKAKSEFVSGRTLQKKLSSKGLVLVKPKKTTKTSAPVLRQIKGWKPDTRIKVEDLYGGTRPEHIPLMQTHISRRQAMKEYTEYLKATPFLAGGAKLASREEMGREAVIRTVLSKAKGAPRFTRQLESMETKDILGKVIAKPKLELDSKYGMFHPKTLKKLSPWLKEKEAAEQIWKAPAPSPIKPIIEFAEKKIPALKAWRELPTEKKVAVRESLFAEARKDTSARGRLTGGLLAGGLATTKVAKELGGAYERGATQPLSAAPYGFGVGFLAIPTLFAEKGAVGGVKAVGTGLKTMVKEPTKAVASMLERPFETAGTVAFSFAAGKVIGLAAKPIARAAAPPLSKAFKFVGRGIGKVAKPVAKPFGKLLAPVGKGIKAAGRKVYRVDTKTSYAAGSKGVMTVKGGKALIPFKGKVFRTSYLFGKKLGARKIPFTGKMDLKLAARKAGDYRVSGMERVLFKVPKGGKTLLVRKAFRVTGRYRAPTEGVGVGRGVLVSPKGFQGQALLFKAVGKGDGLTQLQSAFYKIPKGGERAALGIKMKPTAGLPRKLLFQTVSTKKGLTRFYAKPGRPMTGYQKLVTEVTRPRKRFVVDVKKPLGYDITKTGKIKPLYGVKTTRYLKTQYETLSVGKTAKLSKVFGSKKPFTSRIYEGVARPRVKARITAAELLKSEPSKIRFTFPKSKVGFFQKITGKVKSKIFDMKLSREIRGITKKRAAIRSELEPMFKGTKTKVVKARVPTVRERLALDTLRKGRWEKVELPLERRLAIIGKTKPKMSLLKSLKTPKPKGVTKTFQFKGQKVKVTMTADYLKKMGYKTPAPKPTVKLPKWMKQISRGAEKGYRPKYARPMKVPDMLRDLARAAKKGGGIKHRTTLPPKYWKALKDYKGGTAKAVKPAAPKTTLTPSKVLELIKKRKVPKVDVKGVATKKGIEFKIMKKVRVSGKIKVPKGKGYDYLKAYKTKKGFVDLTKLHKQYKPVKARVPTAKEIAGMKGIKLGKVKVPRGRSTDSWLMKQFRKDISRYKGEARLRAKTLAKVKAAEAKAAAKAARAAKARGLEPYRRVYDIKEFLRKQKLYKKYPRGRPPSLKAKAAPKVELPRVYRESTRAAPTYPARGRVQVGVGGGEVALLKQSPFAKALGKPPRVSMAVPVPKIGRIPLGVSGAALAQKGLIGSVLVTGLGAAIKSGQKQSSITRQLQRLRRAQAVGRRPATIQVPKPYTVQYQPQVQDVFPIGATKSKQSQRTKTDQIIIQQPPPVTPQIGVPLLLGGIVRPPPVLWGGAARTKKRKKRKRKKTAFGFFERKHKVATIEQMFGIKRRKSK